MDTVMTPRVAATLDRRALATLSEGASIAIKREVHELVVSAPAPAFAAAFRAVMMAPESRFGDIRVRRPEGRLGATFEIGERFQGAFDVCSALARRGPAGRLAAAILARTPALARRLEDAFLSDYAEIEVIEALPGGGERLRYRYLEGTPIAGSSTFLVTPDGDARCRVTQIFEYQEVNAFALAAFQHAGLKLHDHVVWEQVRKAAAQAGGQVISATIPRGYVAA
ncbi:MAG: hypothetical protein H6745_06885 [Deltaproteobacteria bacterium]|nr:hypothetical protein [Deltaproteobacteria bacterium]